MDILFLEHDYYASCESIGSFVDRVADDDRTCDRSQKLSSVKVGGNEQHTQR